MTDIVDIWLYQFSINCSLRVNKKETLRKHLKSTYLKTLKKSVAVAWAALQVFPHFVAKILLS